MTYRRSTDQSSCQASDQPDFKSDQPPIFENRITI